MPTVPAEALRDIARRMLEAVGTPADLAAAVGDSLVEGNLVGHDSHGVIRLTTYVRLVREGRVKPDALPSVQVRRQASARVDGAWGWGQAAATLATRTAVGLAREFGVGAGDGRELVFGDGGQHRRQLPDLLAEHRAGQGQLLGQLVLTERNPSQAAAFQCQ